MAGYNRGLWLVLRKIIVLYGAVQSSAWLFLTLVCILLYHYTPGSYNTLNTKMQIDSTVSFTDAMSFCFYQNFFDESSRERDRVLIPRNFHIFAWIYLFISLVWLVLSVYDIHGFYRKPAHLSNHSLMVMGVVILLNSTLDVILFITALYTYVEINPFDYTSPLVIDGEPFPDNMDMLFKYRIGRKMVFGILSILAMRGFVLWLANCFAGGLCCFMAYKIFQMPPILQYIHSIPRPKLQSKLIYHKDDVNNDYNYRRQYN